MYLLGIDLGTTGCKSMVFDGASQILGSSYIEYGLIMTPEGVEQDANAWWENVARAVRESVRESGVGSDEIAALAISSQGIAFVPVSREGAPIYNAISWLDGRATRESAALGELFGERELFSRTGKRLLPCYVLPQLMWMREHRPQVYRDAYKFLMAHDFIVYRMTGRAVTDYSMASGTLAYDLHTRAWMTDILNATGVNAAKLPEIRAAGTIAGALSPAAAGQLGLSPQTLVVIGAQDQRCASIGAGIGAGVVTASLGTSTALCALLDRPVIDPEMRVTCCALDERRWVLESVVATAGAALKWINSTFFPGLAYDALCALAEDALPLCGGVRFYPHLFAESAEGAKGAFTGISLQTRRGDMVRAVLEGVAFQMRLHLEDLRRLGVEAEELRLFGGGAKSPLWCQIIADITGMRVRVPYTHETANLGAAILAGAGAGIFEDYFSAGGLQARFSRDYPPRAAQSVLYLEALPPYVAENRRLIEKRM